MHDYIAQQRHNRPLVSLLGPALGIIFLTGWPTYQFLILGGVESIDYFVAAIGCAMVALLLTRDLVYRIFKEPFFYWLIAYAITGFYWAAFAGDLGSPESRTWRLRVLLALFFIASFYALCIADTRKTALVILGCTLFTAMTFWHDFLTPYFYVPEGAPGSDPGRAAGMFINANQAAGALIAMAVAATPFFTGPRRSLLIGAMVIGVFPTFSRSSMVLAVLVVLLGIGLGQLKKSTLAMFAIIAVAGGIVASILFGAGISDSAINVDNVLDRLNFFSRLGEATDYSANEREYVATLAWNKFLEAPLSGIGIGATSTADGVWGYTASTHNMYLLLLAEQGIVGGLLYAGIVAWMFAYGFRLRKMRHSVYHREIGAAFVQFGMYFVFLGLFSHTLLEEPAVMYSLAFLIVASRRQPPATDSYVRTH